MTSRRLPQLALLAAFLPPCAPAYADEVKVTALRNPVDKSYRKMVAGMDLFERQHALAPAAPLRFKLLPRKRDTDMRAIELDILGESFTTPVAVAPDHSFALERDAKALAEDASVRPNRQKQSMTWRSEIRSPGLPPDTRRLGDLRLECLVGLEADLVSNVSSLLNRLASLLVGPAAYCGRTDAQYLFFSERPVFSVMLTAGARREVLAVDRLYAGASRDPALKETLPYCDCEVLVDRTYFLPLGDASWPDETRVEFEFMDDGDLAPGGGTKTDVAAALGKAEVVSFDSGYEVWVYRGKAPDRDPSRAMPERVILFSPAGDAVRDRLRLPPPVAGR